MDHATDRQGTDETLRRTLAELLPELRAFARFLAASREEADDLVQEAILRTLRSAERGSLPADLYAPAAGGAASSALRPWCLAVVRNVFHEQLRARRRATAHERAAVMQADGVPRSFPQDDRAALQDLSHALAALPPSMREALVLVGAQGLSHEEAAAVCGVPPGTMKARVSRARRQLASLLGATPRDGRQAPAPVTG